MNRVRLGVIGTGFVSRLHLEALQRLRGSKVEVVGVAARDEKKLREFAEEYGISKTYTDWREMINRDDTEVVDICTPTSVHGEMIKAAAAAGKHIICEKPLSGFFGRNLNIAQVGRDVSREVMFAQVKNEIEEIKDVILRNGVKFMYAENWVYAPPYRKLLRLWRTAGGTILDIRAEESHSGSHASYSRRWKDSGGGSLLRLGAHPVGGAIHLKYVEGMEKYGEPIRPASVTGEVGNLTKIPAVQREDKSYIVKEWQDVEDWAVAVINFTDGSKALVVSSDCVLGGVRNEMRVFTSNSVINIDMSQNNSVTAYAPADGIFGDEYITEKIETKAGWSHPSPDEDWMRGYPQEMEDFIDSVLSDRKPESGWYLAEETLKVIYAAYLSAEKGERIFLR